MKIVLSGVQGSGKGTQSAILQEKYGFQIFETGSTLRKIAQENSEIGKEVKNIIESGQLVSDELIGKLVENFLKNVSQNAPILFDGVPRNLAQKYAFDKVVDNYKVLYLNLPKEEVESRLLGRKTCSNCKTIYGKNYHESNCSKCKGELVTRNDDKDENAIQTRINIFFQDTLPLIEEAQKEGNVIEIDANQNIEKVTQQLVEKLGL